MSRIDYITTLIDSIVNDKIKTQLLIERLKDEGLLVMGYGDTEVDQILEKFKDTFGNTRSTRQDRFAAHRLAHKYGPQAVLGIIKLLGDLQDLKYCPRPRNVADMEDKWVSILGFLRKQGKGTEEIS